MKTLLKHLIAAGSVALALSGPAAAAPTWPDAPYSYYAEQESLQEVLRNFASSFSLSLRMDPSVDNVVNGQFNTSNPTEFMNRLGGVYGFNWFVHAGVLFVSDSSKMATRTIDAAGNSISALRQALLQLGVLDTRFGWGELPDQGIALVTGPPEYVQLIERTVDALPMGNGGQQVVVFRLEHASVNDRRIQYRDQEVVTPGLATVLRNLISGAGGGANNEVLSAIAAPLRENPPAFSDSDGSGTQAAGSQAEGASAVVAATTGRSGLRLREPTVQADPRLNAIIVQDARPHPYLS